MPYESNIANLCEAVTEYASVHNMREPVEEILVDQANKLSFWKGENPGLFQEACAIAPSRDKLEALPITRGWKILRAVDISGTRKSQAEGQAGPFRPIFNKNEYHTLTRGKRKGATTVRRVQGTMEGEIDRRVRHRLYQAIGWLSPRLSKYGRANRDKAVVFIQTSGNTLSVVIRNQSNHAAEIAGRTGYVERAVKNRYNDLMIYLGKHLDQVSQKFMEKHF